MILAKKEERKMKRLLIIMAGLLLIGANAFAAGDLLVNGKIGVGLGGGNPAYPLDVNAVGTARGLNIGIETVSNPDKGATAFLGTVYFLGGDAFSRGLKAARYDIRVQGAPDNNSATLNYNDFGAQENTITVGNQNYSGAYTFNANQFAVLAQYQRANNNIRPMTFQNVYGFVSGAEPGAGGSGTITFDKYYHYFVGGFNNSSSMVANNQYGVYISHLNGATNNYGIVLAGDGAGSDIVFGPSKDASIYSSAGELFVKDSGSNVTQISPHDPETGEWRFYSKNVKTGRVIEVNMEKLVKAVEKLTGEKFMIESYEAIE
jgi:hypothetical protein